MFIARPMPGLALLATLSLGACNVAQNAQAPSSAAPPVRNAAAPGAPKLAAAPRIQVPQQPPAPMIAVATAPVPAASQAPQALAIEQATLSGEPPAPMIQAPAAQPPAPMVRAPAARPRGSQTAPTQQALIRAEVLLDRAHFSPGVIDGRTGSNLRRAVSAYQQAHDLTVTGELDAATWQALTAGDAAPVTQDYTLTAADVAGPFVRIPARMEDMRELERLGYSSAREMLAERFHMDERLLASLNPDVDFTTAGQTIVVVRPNDGALPAGIARLEVDKTNNQVRALAEDGRLLAMFPATVGSTERPAPTGDVTVRTVAPNPTYTYDPSRLTFGRRAQGRFTIHAGPNNPVGSTWIDLSEDTYGIHGTPDPTQVGKTASHGCVRLTNWDAAALGRAVRPGMPVAFTGTETRART